MDERGSISLLGVAVLALMGVALLALGEMGASAVRRARATAVADVVALAAVAEPHTAARVASANEAILVSSVRDGFRVEVVVRREGAVATAKAELLPFGWWQCQSPSAIDHVHFGLCPSTPVG